MTPLFVGDTAPQFTLPDADEQLVSLSDYAGRKVIVYFYPAALTPGCTVQAVDFTAARQQLADAGYDVVGISPDTPQRLDKFRQKQDLTVTLLGDPSRDVIKAYSAWGAKTLYGKTVEGVLRSTFVVNVDEHGAGTVESAAYNVRATGHVARMLTHLGLPVS